MVGIHHLMCCLVLSRTSLSVHEKITTIFKYVCFEVEPGYLQESEVKYVFDLIYHKVEISTLY